MKAIIAIAALTLVALPGAGFASGDHKGHAGHGATQSATGPLMADGEVRKVDREQGKITLKHGEIKNLDMSPMTMVFRVKDPAMLDKVKEGDKVGFSADKIGGQFTVTGIEVKK